MAVLSTVGPYDQILFAGFVKPYSTSGPYDQFKLYIVRLIKLGLLSLTLVCSDFWQNWQHKQTFSSSLSFTFLRLINPDNPYEAPFRQPDLFAFSGLLSLTFIFHSSIDFCERKIQAYEA